MSGLMIPVAAYCQSVPDARDFMQRMQFSILEVVVEGGSLVSQQDLTAVAAPYLGTDRSLEDLEAIRLAILGAYRDRGHDLVSVVYVPSRSSGGRHIFTVLEVELGKVTVSGNSVITESSVRDQLPALREGSLPDLRALARQLALFNDQPGRNATVGYSAGDRPGVADADIRVVEGTQTRTVLNFNNTGTADTGYSRIGLSWSHYDVFRTSHQATFGASTSLEEPQKVFGVSLGYRIPVPALGDMFSFGASLSRVKVGTVADVFNIAGRSSAWNVRYTRELSRTPVDRHTLELGYDERHYRDIIDFFATDLGRAVTVKPISLAYRLEHSGDGSSARLGITFQKNLPGDGRNSDASYAASRVGADARWSTLQLEAIWQKALVAGWSLTTRIAGQYARKPLIAAEQFGLGGAGAVRGLPEREAAGDRGLRGSVEFATPRIRNSHWLVAFVDAGRSSRLEVQPGELEGERVASLGLGWRTAFTGGLQINIDAARLINGTSRQPDGEMRLHLNAVFAF